MLRLMWFVYLLSMSCNLLANDLAQNWQRSIQNNKLTFIHQHLHDIDNVDLRTARGKTALMAASFRGAKDLTQKLLAAGADANARNKTGGTALMYAAASGNGEIILLLLQHGASINHQSENGWTALMMAVAKDHKHIVALLANHEADVNLPDVYGWTPLMRATYDGHLEVTRMLLGHPDIAIERHNDHGQTALHLAVIPGHMEIARLLLEHGADSDAKDFAGRTPRSISLSLGYRQLLPGKSSGPTP